MGIQGKIKDLTKLLAQKEQRIKELEAELEKTKNDVSKIKNERITNELR